MNRCPKCGTEFEGNFCPECGEVWSEEKTCPKCGEKVKGSVKFCTNCGYAFYNVPAPVPKEPAPAPYSRAVLAKGWMKLHKKELIVLSLFLLVVLIVSIAVPLYFANIFNGTYYRYSNDTYHKDEYFVLTGGKYKDEDGTEGKYEIKGEKIVFYVELFGSQEEFASGTIKDGVITLEFMGSERIFAKEGAMTKEEDKTEKPNDNDKTEKPNDNDTSTLNYVLNSDRKSYSVSVGNFKGSNLNIPDSYDGFPVIAIADGAFKNCNNLQSVTIGKSVTSIGYQAFYGCKGLQSVTIGSSVTLIRSKAFCDCSRLQSVTWNAENCTEAGSYSDPIFEDCTNLKTVTFGENVKIIPAYAFYGCTGLTSIEIPDSVTSIENSAFEDCSGLKEVTIPYNLTFIGHYAFAGCGNLQSVTIPNYVTSIGSYAFAYCDNLQSTSINSGAIGSFAFFGCGKLQSVTIKSSVTEIGSHAFDGCDALEDLIIQSGIAEIGSHAFYFCRKLQSIRFEGTVNQWISIQKGTNWKWLSGVKEVVCNNGTLTGDDIG